jgi:ATP-dependent DNA ligase
MLFYYPNRPVLVPPDPKNPLAPESWYLDSLEAEGWIGELKWNGDNTLLHTDDWSLWNRRGEPLSYKPTEEIWDELKSIFPPNSIINFETVDRHTKTIKNLLIVHCIMAWKGNLLLGKTWGDSRRILEKLKWGRHVVLSETFKDNFWKRFQDTDGATHEGLVLKKPDGKLKFSTTPIANVPWMRKVRKPCKKYNF